MNSVDQKKFYIQKIDSKWRLREGVFCNKEKIQRFSNEIAQIKLKSI